MNPTIEKLGKLLSRVQRNRTQPRSGLAARGARIEAPPARPPARTPLEIAVEDQLGRPAALTTPPIEVIPAARISEPPPAAPQHVAAAAPQPLTAPATPQRIQAAPIAAPARPIATAVSPVAKAAPATFGQLVSEALSLRLKS